MLTNSQRSHICFPHLHLSRLKFDDHSRLTSGVRCRRSVTTVTSGQPSLDTRLRGHLPLNQWVGTCPSA